MVEVPVHEGHLEFVFKVGYGSESADNGDGALLFREVDEESVEGSGARVGGVAQIGFDQLQPFFLGEKRVLAGVFRNGNDDLVEHAACAMQDVEVSVGDWVESAWIDADPHKPVKTRTLRGPGRDGNAVLGAEGLCKLGIRGNCVVAKFAAFQGLGREWGKLLKIEVEMVGRSSEVLRRPGPMR